MCNGTFLPTLCKNLIVRYGWISKRERESVFWYVPINCGYYILFYFVNVGVQSFSSTWLFFKLINVYIHNISILFHTNHRIGTRRNPLGMIRKCWLWVLNLTLINLMNSWEPLHVILGVGCYSSLEIWYESCQIEQFLSYSNEKQAAPWHQGNQLE